jgi:hypothetical protein
VDDVLAMSRAVCVATAVLTVALAAAGAAGAKRGDGIPAWVDVQGYQEVVRLFGNQPLVVIFHIPYPHKVAVIYEFQNIVRCGACSAPSNKSVPHGRVVRISFDRTTRKMTGALQFCEVHGITPPLADCLRR